MVLAVQPAGLPQRLGMDSPCSDMSQLLKTNFLASRERGRGRLNSGYTATLLGLFPWRVLLINISRRRLKHLPNGRLMFLLPPPFPPSHHLPQPRGGDLEPLEAVTFNSQEKSYISPNSYMGNEAKGPGFHCIP